MAKGAAPHKWVIAGTVLTGTFMAVLDSSIVNVALPHMSGTLGATLEEITWVATGYLLANVLIMPIIAPPPRPWIARNATIVSRSRAAPHAIEASVKARTLTM